MFQPRLLKQFIELIVIFYSMTIKDLSNYVGLSELDIEMMANFPNGYFSEKEEVIDFFKIKKCNK